MNMLRILCFLFIWAASLAAVAQPVRYHFQNFSQREGLSNDLVGALAQDRMGFLWVGTAEGLSRFDGATFFNYSAVGSDPHSLLENRVDNLGVDPSGRVWVGYNSGGFSWFEEASGRFHHITEVHGRPLIDIRRFGIDRAGFLWAIANPVGLIRLDTETREIVVVDSSFTHGYVAVDRLDRVWVNAFDGPTYVLDEHRQRIELPLGPDEIDMFIVVGVVVDTGNVAWAMLFEGGARCFSADLSRQADCPGMEGVDVTTFSAVSERHSEEGTEFWISTQTEGIFVVDPDRATVEHLLPGGAYQLGMNSRAMHMLLAARDGHLWAGSEEGLSQVLHTPEFMKVFRLKDGLVDVRHARPALGHPGHWWVFSWGGGIALLDTLSGENRWLANNENRKRWPYEFEFNNDAIALPDGRLLAVNNRGVTLLDVVALKAENLALNLDIEGAYADGDSVILGTEAGLYSFRPSQKTFRKLFPGSEQGLRGVHRIRRGNGDTLWLATDSGLLKWPSRGSLPQAVPLSGPEPINRVARLELFDDEVWMVSRAGLARFDGKTGDLNMVTKGNPIPTAMARNVYRDRSGRFWIPTFNGIYLLDAEGQAVVAHLTTLSGLPTNRQVQGNGNLIDGKLFLGYDDFLVWIDTDLYEVPPSALADIFLMDAASGRSHIRHDEGTVVLPHRHEPLQVVFAAPEFNGGITPFYYRLGERSPWKSAGTERGLTLPSMASGDYRLQIAADTTLTGSVAGFRFSVKPPWWRQWWFVIMCVLGVGGLFLAFYSYRMQQILAVQQVRNRISRDLHDDVGAALSSIRILSDVADQKLRRHEYVQAQTLLGKVNEQAAQITESMSDTIWAIKPGNDGLDQIMSRLRQQFGDVADSAEVRLTVTGPEGVSLREFSIDARKHMYLIAKEAVHNALRHSRCQSVRVAFAVGKNVLEISVADDGIGFDAAACNGNGLVNMQQRAAQLGGEVQVENGSGTRVTCHVPIP